ncbi:arabinosyltransferase XEG113-like isoform X1 [Ipomoea triloba]|uniref:arabinosyltransferase XEG113-like isoform X1 n=1 Tax=Ipomoea triloba TaxID=35885 RepID=UPI00125CDEF0|nr:arabinosyltransferase XEG113-like isoform X1 [Ipomoea triloba]
MVAEVFISPGEAVNVGGRQWCAKSHNSESYSYFSFSYVMPPIWCRLDRLWFGHPGVLVGSMTRYPFVCPLDHVFEVNVMLREQPEEEFGPGISFREYSLFDNPLMPQEVKESWLDV